MPLDRRRSSRTSRRLTPTTRVRAVARSLLRRAPRAIGGRAHHPLPVLTDKPFFAVPEVTLARDARTGAEVWRSDALGFDDAALSGVGRDGIRFAGERAGSVVVFDCQRGSIRRRAAMSRGAEPQVEATEQGLFVRDGPRAMLLGWRDGQARWEVVLPLDGLALVAASPTPGPDRRFGNAVRGARWLAPDDGRTLADSAFLPGADWWPRRSTAGGPLLAGKRLEGFGRAARASAGWARRRAGRTSSSAMVRASPPGTATP